MGKRSRKRSLSGEGQPRSTGDEGSSAPTGSSRAERDAERRRRRADAAAAASGGRSGRRGTRERPQAPWGRFPLSEIVVLMALVIGVAGLIVGGEQGLIMLVAALALGSLAGLELAAREHFAGYRSHSSLLAASAAFGAGAVVVALPGTAPRIPTAVVALGVFAVAFWLLRQAFKRRSGGLGFR
jgi:hypothetical protein